MVNIQFPDGAVRSFEQGITPMAVAKGISEGLAKKVIAASIDGVVSDASTPINKDAALKLITWDDADGKSTFWHSTAHLLAEAVEATFPGVKFWVGPAIDRGFYYDMDLGGTTISEEELSNLEKKMGELAKQNNILTDTTSFLLSYVLSLFFIFSPFGFSEVWAVFMNLTCNEKLLDLFRGYLLIFFQTNST
jgi:threonyl-tRNA synthetase